MEDTELRTITRWGKIPAWWLLHPSVDADRFCLLAALATYADDEGYCEPSQATLARHLRRSRPWVNRVIADLAAEGLLEKTTRARRNGGTTSCRYRLAQVPLESSDVVPKTRACHADGAPRHGRDQSQPEPEQNQNTRLVRRTAKISDQDIPETSVASVPADWTPSVDAIKTASATFPDADTASHSVMFVARCRSKGYRYRLETLDDTWLAWFIEDHRRDLGRRPKAGITRSSAVQKRDVAAARFEAWAVSATAPKLSPAGWS